MNYEEWNSTLLALFFNEEQAGRSVRLYMTKPDLERIGPGTLGFIEAINAGPKTAYGKGGPCDQAHRLFNAWNGQEDPPFFAYLVCFVVAWTLEDPEFQKIDYHGRLRALLCRDDKTGQFPSFNLMYKLWHGLEEWANVSQAEARGRFVARTTGTWPHVGYPIAQAIFSGDQRHHLHDFFHTCSLSPYQDYTNESLARLLIDYGQKALTPQQFAGVSNPAHENHEALLGAVRHELDEWRAELQTPGAPEYHPLLAVQFFPGLNRLTTFMHVQTAMDIPADGQDVHDDEGNAAYFEQGTSAISGPLHDIRTGRPLALDSRDIEHPRTWTTPGGQHIKSPRKALRIFAPLPHLDSSTFYERQTVPPRGPHIIVGQPDDVAARKDTPSALRSEEFRNVQGVPQAWILLRHEAPAEDAIPMHAPSRIRLVGGIRSERGPRFFDFAPPLVEVNLGPREQLLLNGITVSTNPWLLQESPPGRYAISIESENSPIARQVVELITPLRHVSPFPSPALHHQVPATRSSPARPRCSCPGHVLIGSSPGQIVETRDSESMPGWRVSWQICRGRPPRVTRIQDTRSLPPWTPLSRGSPMLRRWRAWTWGIRSKVVLNDAELVASAWFRFLTEVDDAQR